MQNIQKQRVRADLLLLSALNSARGLAEGIGHASSLHTHFSQSSLSVTTTDAESVEKVVGAAEGESL
jgi:hypothetical protein